MSSNEIIVANMNRIADLYKTIGILTEMKEREEDWDIRGSYNRAITGFEDAIENLNYVNKALKSC